MGSATSLTSICPGACITTACTYIPPSGGSTVHEAKIAAPAPRFQRPQGWIKTPRDFPIPTRDVGGAIGNAAPDWELRPGRGHATHGGFMSIKRGFRVRDYIPEA